VRPGWSLDNAGPDAAARKLAEIEAAIVSLKATSHKGSLRDEIAPGLHANPASRKTVLAYVVDDDAGEVLIYAVTCGGADWAMRGNAREGMRSSAGRSRRDMASTSSASSGVGTGR